MKKLTEFKELSIAEAAEITGEVTKEIKEKYKCTDDQADANAELYINDLRFTAKDYGWPVYLVWEMVKKSGSSYTSKPLH